MKAPERSGQSPRRDMEQALRQSEEQFRRMIRLSPMAIALTDDRGRFEHLNDQFIRTFGYTLEDLPDLEAWWKKAYPDEAYRREVLATWQDAMDNSTWEEANRAPFEFRVTCRDGTVRFAEILANRIGKKYLYLLNDVTERVRAQEAMSRMQGRFMQAQKMEAIGRLAGGVAHDFNNLLTSILGYSELIRSEEFLAPTIREGIEEIDKAARRAAGLTQQLLAFGRKQMLKPREIDLNALVLDLERMLQRLIGEHIRLTSSTDAEGARVLADPGQIEQVIINLSVNARDAMPGGGSLSIGTRCVTFEAGSSDGAPEMTPGEYVELTVKDTGAGMDAMVLAHLFEPFFTTKEIGKGTGLGLSTVYGIVNQSGGFILVRSEVGQGTTFRIYLPRLTEPAPQPPAAVRDPGPRRGTETILLVEDDTALLQMTARMLKRFGYTVEMMRDPAAALDRLSCSGCPVVDLLLTDVVMPGMSGRELADRLAASRPGLKVLFMSGYTDDAILHHGVLDEGIAFLQKPFTPHTLARKVREVLDSPEIGDR